MKEILFVLQQFASDHRRPFRAKGYNFFNHGNEYSMSPDLEMVGTTGDVFANSLNEVYMTPIFGKLKDLGQGREDDSCHWDLDNLNDQQ